MPKSIRDVAGISITGKAEIAAFQLSEENLGDSVSETGLVTTGANLTGESSCLGLFSGLLSGVSSFSEGVGQIPSCSYRSKKLELVGGAFNDILVDLERGKRTGPDPLFFKGVVPIGDRDADEGKAGRGVDGGRLNMLREVSVDRPEGVLGALLILGLSVEGK